MGQGHIHARRRGEMLGFGGNRIPGVLGQGQSARPCPPDAQKLWVLALSGPETQSSSLERGGGAGAGNTGML